MQLLYAKGLTISVREHHSVQLELILIQLSVSTVHFINGGKEHSKTFHRSPSADTESTILREIDSKVDDLIEILK